MSSPQHAAFTPRPHATLVDLPETPRASAPSAAPLYAAFLMNLGLILLFWKLASGGEVARTPADALNAAGRVTALVGTYLILWQLLLMARLPPLQDAFGMENLAQIHRWNAYPAVLLIAAHAVLQTLGYQTDNGTTILAQLGDFVAHYDGLLGAVVGLLLLVLVTILSVGIARRYVSYHAWYFVHLYAYLAVALAFLHQLATGADFIESPVFAAYWYLLYAAVAAALVWFRALGPLRLFMRHRFAVQRVRRETSGTVSIYVGGRDLELLRYEAGQFMLWRFLDRERWWEAHPFTLSAPPGGRQLRLTVKGIGDFSARAAKIRPGTHVLVEGPFGHFTAGSCRRAKALLVAGGIGITPLRALAEDLAGRGVDVCLIYRAHRERDLALRVELDALASDRRIRIEYLSSDRKVLGRPAAEWLEARNLVHLVPDVADREAYVCGPAGLTRAVRRTLAMLDVGPSQIHTEAFSF